MKKTTLAATATLGAALIIVASPLAASAHVSLDGNTAEPDSYALLTFKVPNESETAGTSAVEIALPEDADFSSIRYVPTPGWIAEVTDDSVTFTAEEGNAIVGESLQLFSISVGPVPDVDSLAFVVEQRYDDGEIVAWEGDEAPTLYVNTAPEGDHHAAEDAEGTDDEATVSAETTTGSDDVLARVLGIAGLVLGAIALALAIVTRRRA